MKKYDSGFNDGVMYAVQLTASNVLRLIDNHPTWMLKSDKAKAKAEIRLLTRRILQRRRLVPSTYSVIRGEAEDVELDFNMD